MFSNNWIKEVLTPATPKIAIFDSGLGGLSIYKSVRKRFPAAEFAYCSDNEAFPYGSKSEDELVDRVSSVLEKVNQFFNPNIVIIACNTASTVALPKIRSLIPQPVIGVVPAIKPAATLSTRPYIGLLATPGTVQRTYTQNLIDQFGSSKKWIKVGSEELVLMAEKKMLTGVINHSQLTQILLPFSKHPSSELDTIVLGCTHFPLIKEELIKTLPHISHWIDSSEAIAERCSFWLHELGLYSGQINNHNEKDKNLLLFTKNIDQADGLINIRNEYGFKEHQVIKI